MSGNKSFSRLPVSALLKFCYIPIFIGDLNYKTKEQKQNYKDLTNKKQL